MLSSDSERNIREAWLKLRPAILSDPQQLAKRLARRRLKTLMRPPRAWCLALRASDRRITPMHWILTPMHAMDLDHPDHPYEPIEHTVTIQKHGIRRVCNPVSFSIERAVELEKEFGLSRGGLRNARGRGLFFEDYKNYPCGRVPFLSPNGQIFDPNHREFSPPHPLWGTTWEFLSHAFPDDFQQTITRKPIFKLVSGGSGTSGGADILVRQPHTPAGGADIPVRHPYGPEDFRFRGYHWLCPTCKKSARTLYFPIPVRTIFGWPGFPEWDPFIDPLKEALPDLTDADLPHISPPTFACAICHQVNSSNSSIEPRFWNYVISHLTAGLLFGCEVPKPASLIPKRKRTRTRQLNRSSPIMRKVLTRLANGWTDAQIAHDLNISPNAVRHHVRRAMAQEQVPDRHALAHKLGHAHSPPFNKQERTGIRRLKVKQLLLHGLTNHQIAEKLSQPHYTIARDIDKIYAIHGLRGHNRNSRKALANLLGVQLPPTPSDLLQQKISPLLNAGMLRRQIASRLNLSRGTVDYHIQKIKQAKQPSPAPATQSPRMASVGLPTPAPSAPVGCAPRTSRFAANDADDFVQRRETVGGDEGAGDDVSGDRGGNGDEYEWGES